MFSPLVILLATGHCPLDTYLKRSHARLLLSLLGWKNFALINPDLHANYAVGSPGFRKAVLNVSPQRGQRQPALQVPLRACDFISIQPSAHSHLDSLATEAQRRIHRFAHGAPESNTLLQLQSNRLGNKLRVELRLVHFLDVDKHFARRALLQVDLQLVDLRALAPDNNSRPRRLDDDPQLVARPLNL